MRERDAPTEVLVKPPESQAERGASLAPTVFAVLYIASMAGALYVLRYFVTDLILAILIVSLSYSKYRRLRVRVGHNGWLAAGMMTVWVLVLIAIPTGFLVVSLSNEAAVVYEMTKTSFSLESVERFLMGESWLAHQIRNTSGMLGVTLDRATLQGWISRGASTVAFAVYGQINAILANLLSLSIHFGIMIVAVFYLYIDGIRFKQWVFRLSPLPYEQEEILASKFLAVGRAILFGNGIGSLVQGVIGGITMWLVGFESVVLWTLVMTIFAFLPLIGISFIILPASIYLALEGRYFTTVVFFMFNMGQALIVDNLVKTRLIGSQMQMHDLVIFLAIVGGLSVFGVIGLLYGPLILAAFMVLSELFDLDYKPRFKVPVTKLKT